MQFQRWMKGSIFLNPDNLKREPVMKKIIDFTPHESLDNLSRGKYVEIIVPPSTKHYYDLSRSHLSVRAWIITSDSAPIKEGDKVAFINQPLTSMWRSIKFTLQAQDFTKDVNICQPFKASIDNLLYRALEYLASSAQGALYFKDTAGAMDSVDVSCSAGTNTGLISRFEFTSKGKTVSMEGPLPLDIAQSMSSYIPSGWR